MAAALRGSEIVVRLRERPNGPLAPRLALHRPLDVVRVALQRPPDAFLRMLPLLFPLCGMAHAIAGLRAVESAAGIVPAAEHEAARRVVCLADALAAHVWRSEFDWPALTGDEGRPARVAAARRATSDLAAVLYPDGDLLAPGGGRLHFTVGAVQGLADTLAAVASGLPLEQGLARLRAGMPAVLAGADPDWVPRLLTRFRVVAAQARADAEALLAALSTLPTASVPAAVSARIGDGEGVGRVATARGELSYRLRLRAGVVVDCHLQAPIDRVFGAEGEAGSWLAGLDRAARPAAAVRWVLAALDPCAPVRIEDAESMHA